MLFNSVRSFVTPSALIRIVSRPTNAGINPLAAVGSNTGRALFSTTPGGGDDTTVVATCTAKISKALETEQVTVTGAYDDPNGSHISIIVVSDMFEGKRIMSRQQMVYKAIWEEMQGAVHAVDSMVCKTPSEV